MQPISKSSSAMESEGREGWGGDEEVAVHFPSGRAGDGDEGNEKVLGKERVLVTAAS